jgi:hypothetical protein
MRGMALIGATLHFSYSDMLDMELDEFNEFVEISNEIVEKQST